MHKQTRTTWMVGIPLTLGICTGTIACGGGGGGGGSQPSQPQPGPGAAAAYILDPSTASVPQTDPTGTINYYPSGISSTGAWYITTPTGYYLNGALTAFPNAKVTGGTVTAVVGAGGPYIWASYSLSSGQNGLAILNLTTSNIIQVPGVDTGGVDSANDPFPLVLSPDGSSAFVYVEAANGTETGQFETLTAAGVPTVFTGALAGFEPAARSTAGWTVGSVFASNASRARQPALRAALLWKHRALKARGKAIPATQSPSSASLISPTGTVITLNGSQPYPTSVNDTGVAAGYDGATAVFWDASGNEHGLQDGTVWDVLDNGLMVGSYGDTVFRGGMWQPGGYLWDLTSLSTLLPNETMTDAIEMQTSSGSILCAGSDPSGNPIFFGIVPAPTPSLRKAK